MRVTNVMMIENMKYNLHTNMGKLERLQYETAQGKRFRYPSDDPIRVTRSLKYYTDISKSEQHLRNVSDATSWMTTTEAAMNELRAIVHRTHELTVQASNSTNREELDKIKAEIDELKGSAIQLANSTYAGRSLFSGLQTNKPLLKTSGDIAAMYHAFKDGVTQAEFDKNPKFYQEQMEDLKSLFKDHSEYYNDKLKAYEAHKTEVNNQFVKEYQSLLEGYKLQATKSKDPAAAAAIGTANGKPQPASIVEYRALVNEYKAALELDGKLKESENEMTKSLNQKNTELETSYTTQETELNAEKAKADQLKADVQFFETKLAAMSKSATWAELNNLQNIAVGNPPSQKFSDFIKNNYDFLKLQIGEYNIDLKNSEKFEYNTGVAERVEVNTLGYSIFGGKYADPDSPDYNPIPDAEDKSVRKHEKPFLIGLLENISKNLNHKDQVEIKKDITRVKDVLDNVLKVTSEFGAKTNRMKLTKNKIEDSVFNLKSLMSDNEDVSLAEAMTKLLTEENVYRASLGVTGRIVQPSLMDFLR